MELEAKSSLYKTGKTVPVELWPVMLVGDSLMLGMFGNQAAGSAKTVHYHGYCTVAQTTKTNVIFCIAFYIEMLC